MEKTVQCFMCEDHFHNPNDLFTHIKEVHGVCGKSNYRCTCQCTEIFGTFGSYKTHVKRCFDEMNVQDEREVRIRAELLQAYNDVAMEDEEIKNFRVSVESEAFRLACKFNAIMMLPRDLVYKMIKDYSQFLQTVIVEGIKKVIVPRVPPSERKVAKDFMGIINSAFSDFETEWKFEKALKRADVLEPFDRCLMPVDFVNEPNTQFDDLEKIENESSVLMPLHFQIKKFLELPGVYTKMVENVANIQQQGKLNHFINGSLWKEKLSNFDENQTVVPYHYYSDGAQLNHPLGPHIRKGSENFQYYSFPTIPFQYQSRLENIFLSHLFPEYFYQDYTLEGIYGNLIDALTKLATDGILINVESTQHKVHFVLGAFLADNKEANVAQGFARSYSANKYCRYCDTNKTDARYCTIENPSTRRNRINYDENVVTEDLYETGIHEFSTFNNIPFFHVTESSAEDISHSVDEGIGKYNLSDALCLLIYEAKLFTLTQLNRRIKDFSYASEEKSNIPKTILETHLKGNTLKMTASESANLIQNITFLIGDMVPEDNAVWQLILKTVKFFDFSYLPCYEEDDLNSWTRSIHEMHEAYIELCSHLKPHHHIAIHFPTDTRKFGPLRYTRTIRYEGKHRELKSYAKNSNNRIDISYSIAKKIQYNFAHRLVTLRGLEDSIDGNYKPGTIKEKVYYSKLQQSAHKDRLDKQSCLFTDKINVNGMQINRALLIPDVNDDTNKQIRKVHEIFDIVLITPTNINDFFAVCKTYDVIRNEHFAGYEIDKSTMKSEFSIINLSDFLECHHYPIMPHKIGSRFFFRCKRF